MEKTLSFWKRVYNGLCLTGRVLDRVNDELLVGLQEKLAETKVTGIIMIVLILMVFILHIFR